MAHPRTQHYNNLQKGKGLPVFKTEKLEKHHDAPAQLPLQFKSGPLPVTGLNHGHTTHQQYNGPFRNSSAPKTRISSASLFDNAQSQRTSSMRIIRSSARFNASWKPGLSAERMDDNGASLHRPVVVATSCPQPLNKSNNSSVYITKEYTTLENPKPNKSASNARSQSPASAKAKAAFKYLNAKVVAERLVKALTKEKGEVIQKKVLSENKETHTNIKPEPKPAPAATDFKDQGLLMSPSRISLAEKIEVEAEHESNMYQDRLDMACDMQVDKKLIDKNSIEVLSTEGMAYHDSSQRCREGFRGLAEYGLEPLEAKARALEEQAAMLGTGNELSDVLIRTLVEDQEYNALEMHIDELNKEFRRHMQEKRDLLLQMARELRCQISERACAEEALRMLRAEMGSKAQMLEREKAEFLHRMQEEMEEGEAQWVAKLEKLKSKEKRMAERLKEIAEEKVELQKEVSTLASKKNALVEEVKMCQKTMKELKQKVEESGQEVVRLRKVLADFPTDGNLTRLVESASANHKAMEVGHTCAREEELLTLLSKYQQREKELAQEKHRAVSKLQRVSKEQEKTIQGLRLALGEDVGNANLMGKGEFFVKLQRELIRLTGLEQSLRKEMDLYRADASAAKQENAKLVERLGLITRKKLSNEANFQTQQAKYTNKGGLEDNHIRVSINQGLIVDEKVEENSQAKIREDQLEDKSMAIVLMNQYNGDELQSFHGGSDELEMSKLVQSGTRLQEEADNLHSALTLTNRRVRELEIQLSSKEEELKGAQEELGYVKEQRDAMQKEADYMGREAIRLSTQVEHLSQRVEKLDEDIMVKDGQLSILRGAFQQDSD